MLLQDVGSILNPYRSNDHSQSHSQSVNDMVFEHSPTQAVTTGQMYIMAVTL